jgi:hypothetical protein
MESSLKSIVNHNHELINREKAKRELWPPGVPHPCGAPRDGGWRQAGLHIVTWRNDTRSGRAREEEQQEDATGQSGGAGGEIPAPGGSSSRSRGASGIVEDRVMDESGRWQSDPPCFEILDEALAYARASRTAVVGGQRQARQKPRSGQPAPAALSPGTNM